MVNVPYRSHGLGLPTIDPHLLPGTSSLTQGENSSEGGVSNPWPKAMVSICAIGSGLNSLYFHIIGDGKLNPTVAVYIPMK